MAKKSSTKQKLSTALKRYWNTKGRSRRKKKESKGPREWKSAFVTKERDRLLTRGTIKNQTLSLGVGKRQLLKVQKKTDTYKPALEIWTVDRSRQKNRLTVTLGKKRKLLDEVWRKKTGRLPRSRVYALAGLGLGAGALGAGALVLSRRGVQAQIGQNIAGAASGAVKGAQDAVGRAASRAQAAVSSAVNRVKQKAQSAVEDNVPGLKALNEARGRDRGARKALGDWFNKKRGANNDEFPDPWVDSGSPKGKGGALALRSPGGALANRSPEGRAYDETRSALARVDRFVGQQKRNAQAAVLKAQRRDRRAKQAAKNMLYGAAWKLRGWLPFSLYEQNLAEFKRRSARRGKPLSAAHKRKISESLKRKYGGGSMEDSAGSTARTLEAIARAGESASRAVGNLARAQRTFKSTRYEYSPLGRTERLLRGGGLTAIGTLGAAGIRTGGQLRGARIRAGSVLDASRTAAAARNRASDAIVAAARWRYKAAKQNRKTKGIAQVIRVIREVRK